MNNKIIEKPPEEREVNELEFAINVLGSMVNFAMRNGCLFTDALKMHGPEGDETWLRAEKAVLKGIQTLILEVTSREDNVQANPNMLKQLSQWKIEL